MTPETSRHQRLYELFIKASRLEPGARPQFLGEACTHDATLRAEVEAMLAVDQRADGWLSRVVVDRDAVDRALEAADPQRERPVASAPEIIGPYRITGVLGHGGMGVVYEAKQERPHRTVALKVIRPGFASPALLQRFRREADLLARLSHPGIAHIYEVGQTDEQPFIAMELVRGTPLLEAARERSRPERLALFLSVCDAVDYAHRSDVIHRDLKPDNILVDGEGCTKVLDFGVARLAASAVGAGHDATTTGQIVGTTAYMSPEQFRGSPTIIDQRADVYGLGVILYELLTDTLPHEVRGLSVLETARLVCETDAPRLGASDSALRGDLEVIVGKAVARDRSRRYASVRDIADDVRRFLERKPITARPPSLTYQVRMFGRRHRVLVSTVAAAFVVLLGALVVTSVLLQRALAAESELSAQVEANELIITALAPGPERQTRFDEIEEQLDRMSRHTERGAARSRSQFGAALYELGDYARAERQLRAALAVGFPDDELVELRTAEVLGELLHDRQELDEAKTLYERVLARRGVLLGRTHPETLTALHNRALLHQEQGEPEDAERLLREVLAEQRALLEPTDPDLLTTMNSLGVLLHELDRFQEAEPLLVEAVEKRRLVPNWEQDPAALTALASYGAALWSVGEEDRAVEVTQEALRLRRKTLPALHPDVLLTQQNLGAMLAGVGRTEEALPIVRSTIAAQREFLGEDHEDTLASRHTLGVLLRKLGQYDEAIAEMRDVVARAERALGTPNFYTGVFTANLGMALFEGGYLEEARPTLELAYTRLCQNPGPDADRTRQVAAALARLCRALGDEAAAREWETRAKPSD